MATALKVSQLSKTYNNQLTALDGIDLTVEQGDFFALLGSNGAGKTTAIGIICGLLTKTAGSVEVFGLNQDTQTNAVKHLIGLMPQEFNFDPFEPIEEILVHQAGYYGIGRVEAKEHAQVLLKKMQLWDKRSEMAKLLSGGMKRRLMLARALIHRPKILILDEPTAGVDVEIRRSIWDYLQALNAEGMTIILTTHYLEEAESLCRHIAILDNGKVIEQGNMKKILSKVAHQVLILESNVMLPAVINPQNFTCERLDDYSLRVVLDTNTNVTQVLQNLFEQGVNINHVRSTQNRIETLFLDLATQVN